jgi:hypothetical protein
MLSGHRGNPMKTRILCFSMICWAGLAHGGARPAEIVVLTGSQTGLLDMGKMALGQGGLSEEPMWEGRAAEIRALRPKIIRLFVQEYFRLLPARGRYDFSTLDRSVDLILRTGAKPLMTLVMKPPVLFPTINQDLVEPGDWGEWERLVTAMVKHYQARGAGIEYWEVGNEPDIGEDGGCPYRFQPANYLTYYERTVKAILRADPRARVGGPALANWKSPILPALLEFCARGNAPLHFVSWHLYTSSPEQLRQTIVGVKKLLAAHPNLRVETMLNEWNIALMRPDANNLIMQPAYVMESIANFIDEGLDYSCYYHIRDYHVNPATFARFMSPRGVAFMASWWNYRPQYHGLFDFQNEVRPAYFAFKLLSRVTGKRLKVEATGARALAAYDEQYQATNVLLWNFSDQPVRARVELRGLDKETRVERIRLDARAVRTDESARLVFEPPLMLSATKVGGEAELEPYGVELWFYRR